jgi:hypothetical protein
MEVQVAVGQVDAFVRGEFGSSHASVGDSHVKAIRFLSFDDPSNPAIVEPDPLSGTNVLEDLG